jgi:hypothetical protein
VQGVPFHRIERSMFLQVVWPEGGTVSSPEDAFQKSQWPGFGNGGLNGLCGICDKRPKGYRFIGALSTG